jgi:hypothetical protein
LAIRIRPIGLAAQAGGNRNRLWRVMFQDLHRGMIPDWWALMDREPLNAAGARNWLRSRPVTKERWLMPDKSHALDHIECPGWYPACT